MAMDYSSLWEAFAGGSGWSGKQLGPSTDYQARTTKFYDEIVGPAFGYDIDPDIEGLQGKFGEDYTGLMANIDRYALEEAEKEFRMAIGDPYGRGDASDPFAWETISRMGTYGGIVGEAQQMLEGELYHRGDELGGGTGAAYGEGIGAGQSAYATGMEAQREGLTYGGLTSGVALQSGTSGATLRSGTGMAQAEDILIDAYESAKTLGGSLQKSYTSTEDTLKTSLDEALSAYTAVIEREKEDWYNDVLGNVTRIQGMGDEDDPSLFIGAREAWDADLYGEGLTYQSVAADLRLQEDRGFASDVCGIGEIWDGSACVAIEGLTKDEYGDLVDTEGGMYPGCTDPSAENYNPHAETDNGSCYYAEVISGCTNPNAQNYNSDAEEDDGSCTYLQQEEDDIDCPEGWSPDQSGGCQEDDPDECPEGQYLDENRECQWTGYDTSRQTYADWRNTMDQEDWYEMMDFFQEQDIDYGDANWGDQAYEDWGNMAEEYGFSDYDPGDIQDFADFAEDMLDFTGSEMGIGEWMEGAGYEMGDSGYEPIQGHALDPYGNPVTEEVWGGGGAS